MVVYEAVLWVVSFCTILSCIRPFSRNKDLLYWICTGGIIIISALRSADVGADTLTYCQEYQNIRTLSFESAMNFRWEQGYVAVNWVLGQFFESERALLVFLTIFILIPIFGWIKKESRYPLLSLVMFIGMGMWNASIGIFRQWCAIAILTISYKYIKTRRFVPFLIVVLIAMLFHRTAAIFLLAYFVESIPLNKNIIIAAMPASAMIGLMGNKILNILNRFARIPEGGNFNGGISLLMVLWLCVGTVLICYKGNIPEELKFYMRLVLFAAFIQPIAFTFSNWARIVVYFSVSLLIFLPNFVSKLIIESRVNAKISIPMITAVCGLMFFWLGRIDVGSFTFIL